MNNVISVPQWGRVQCKDGIVEKFLSCDKFIRSKVTPPPIGSIVFTFAGGKVTITGDTTNITGDDCDVVIRGNFVCISGCKANANEMFCSIHREIEEIAMGVKPNHPPAPEPEEISLSELVGKSR